MDACLEIQGHSAPAAEQQSFSSRRLSSLLGHLAIKRGRTSGVSLLVCVHEEVTQNTQLYFLDQIRFSQSDCQPPSSSLRESLTLF